MLGWGYRCGGSESRGEGGGRVELVGVWLSWG